jgi:hypothetical protein
MAICLQCFHYISLIVLQITHEVFAQPDSILAIILQLPNLETLSIQFSAATAISSHVAELSSPPLNSNCSQSQSYFTRGGLPLIRLGVKPFATHDQYFFQLNTCGYSPNVTSSLTRGPVCRLQLLLVLANAVTLGSGSRGTHDHILIRDSHNLECQPPRIDIPLDQGGPVVPLGIGFPFRRVLRLGGLRWRYSNRLHTQT